MLLQALRDLWRREPARVAAVIAYVVIVIAAKAGVVVDEQSALAAVLIGLPILLGGEAVRGQVVPLDKLKANPSHLPPDKTDTAKP